MISIVNSGIGLFQKNLKREFPAKDNGKKLAKQV
jgi:hypothetical protein